MRLGSVLILPKSPAEGIRLCIAAEAAGAERAVCAYSLLEAREMLTAEIIDAVILCEYSHAGSGAHILKCVPNFCPLQFPYLLYISDSDSAPEICDIVLPSGDNEAVSRALLCIPRAEIPKCANRAYRKAIAEAALMLDSCGFAHRQSGYKYLIATASRLAIRTGEKDELGKCVYPFAARAFGTNTRGIERCIRHSIEWAFTYGNAERLYELFGETVSDGIGKPTNGQLIRLLSDKIRQTKNDTANAGFSIF